MTCHLELQDRMLSQDLNRLLQAIDIEFTGNSGLHTLAFYWTTALERCTTKID